MDEVTEEEIAKLHELQSILKALPPFQREQFVPTPLGYPLPAKHDHIVCYSSAPPMLYLIHPVSLISEKKDPNTPIFDCSFAHGKVQMALGLPPEKQSGRFCTLVD